MDALLRDVRELDELVLGRQPQLEPGCAQTEAEEGRDVYCKTLT
jgi:hypothetical protein